MSRARDHQETAADRSAKAVARQSRLHYPSVEAEPAAVPHPRTQPGGESLEPADRDSFEQRLGHDLARVRIHRDDEAAARASVLQSRAFTIGSDVYFGRNQYSPRTDAGRALLGHELAHVLQQQRLGDSLQRQEIPPELLGTPHYAVMKDEQLRDRHDWILEVLAQFDTSTLDTGLLVEQAADIATELGRRQALVVGRTFTEDDIKRMRDYFVKNAKTEKDSCIVALNKGMSLVTGRPTLDTTSKSIEKTMEKVAASGLSTEAREIAFQSASGRITSGGARPAKLNENIWDTVLAMSGGDPGWSVFTMSLMDGHHSVTLTLDASDTRRPHVYWSDQWQSKGGWKEYNRTSLDEEVVKLVQRWWDGQPVGKKHKTVVRLWRLRSSATAAMSNP